MEEALDFPEIIKRYRSAPEDSDEAERLEMLFDDNTRAWADVVLSLHIKEYGINARHKSELWETVKAANIDILKTIEIEISFHQNVMDFYMIYIHQSLLMGYLHNTPRLAEIIRKNVKWKLFNDHVLPELKQGCCNSMSGRKISGESYNPPVFDAWSAAKDLGYPDTLQGILKSHEQSGQSYIVEQDACIDDMESRIQAHKIDIDIRKMIWNEVADEVKNMMQGDWNYKRAPFENPDVETNIFFRTTLNWFLMNFFMQSQDFSGRVQRVINDLLAKEKYNLSIGAVDAPQLSELMKSFGKHAPTTFFSDKNVGIKGIKFGVLFDKVTNTVLNKILLPELAQFAPDNWGVER